MTEHRDRAAGWRYAKLSGHSNEDRVKELLDTDAAYRAAFLRRIGCGGETVAAVSVGGLHETSVPGVLGRKTKSKTDLKLFFKSGRSVNLSIKKSLGGQVYFVGAGDFVRVYETQFGQSVPAEVKRAICLFWAAADDAVELIQKYGDKSAPKAYELQLRHKSLNATTLRAYDARLWHALKEWFAGHCRELTKLSFAMGAARDPAEWAGLVWYINLLGESDVDRVFRVDDICRAAAAAGKKRTQYGDGAGTTIQLPFGFVQWHQKKLQFHHSFDKLCQLAME